MGPAVTRFWQRQRWRVDERVSQLEAVARDLFLEGAEQVHEGSEPAQRHQKWVVAESRVARQTGRSCLLDQRDATRPVLEQCPGRPGEMHGVMGMGLRTSGQGFSKRSSRLRRSAIPCVEDSLVRVKQGVIAHRGARLLNRPQ
jgi:hypothetical protein